MRNPMSNVRHNSSSRQIEKDSYLFEFISEIAERESWRKEIYRPIYHIHKWWAKRLGSVFRGILLGCMLPEDIELREAFYKEQNFDGCAVFDPFMGSGTTIGEAHKLGFTALGRDINPVACENVRIALGPLNRQALMDAFDYLSSSVGKRIRSLYWSTDENGHDCNVLYYFWVKNIPCPNCDSKVDLFPNRVIARNAYPNRKPEVQVCCPRCGWIFRAHNDKSDAICDRCRQKFSPQAGNASVGERPSAQHVQDHSKLWSLYER